MMWFLLVFLGLPLLEIALFVEAGRLIGLWGVLGLVLLAAVAGVALLQRQAVRTETALRAALSGLRVAPRQLGDGAAVVVAALLLILPGFFSDAVAMVLLVPPLRRLILARLGRGVRVVEVSGLARHEPHRPDIIDAEYHEIEPGAPPQRPARPPRSGWTDR